MVGGGRRERQPEWRSGVLWSPWQEHVARTAVRGSSSVAIKSATDQSTWSGDPTPMRKKFEKSVLEVTCDIRREGGRLGAIGHSGVGACGRGWSRATAARPGGEGAKSHQSGTPTVTFRLTLDRSPPVRQRLPLPSSREGHERVSQRGGTAPSVCHSLTRSECMRPSPPTSRVPHIA